MEQIAVGTSAYLVDRLYHHDGLISPSPLKILYSLVTHRRVKVNKDGARDVFAIVGLREKRLVRAVLLAFGGNIGIYMAIGHQAVLEQVTV